MLLLRDTDEEARRLFTTVQRRSQIYAREPGKATTTD